MYVYWTIWKMSDKKFYSHCFIANECMLNEIEMWWTENCKEGVSALSYCNYLIEPSASGSNCRLEVKRVKKRTDSNSDYNNHNSLQLQQRLRVMWISCFQPWANLWMVFWCLGYNTVLSATASFLWPSPNLSSWKQDIRATQSNCSSVWHLWYF